MEISKFRNSDIRQDPVRLHNDHYNARYGAGIRVIFRKGDDRPDPYNNFVLRIYPGEARIHALSNREPRRVCLAGVLWAYLIKICWLVCLGGLYDVYQVCARTSTEYCTDTSFEES